MAGNIKKPKTILYNHKNKPENYLTPGSQMEWGGMRFNPPFQWDVSPNREWFGLMQMMCSMDLPKNAVMIEIGTYAGESTMMFASIVCICLNIPLDANIILKKTGE